MGTRLYVVASDSIIEKLVGVPAGTMEKLNELKKFDSNPLEHKGYAEWFETLGGEDKFYYSRDGYGWYKYVSDNYPDIDALQGFQVFGYGKLTHLSYKVIQENGLDPLCGTVTDDHLKIELLCSVGAMLHGVKIAEIQEVHWS